MNLRKGTDLFFAVLSVVGFFGTAALYLGLIAYMIFGDFPIPVPVQVAAEPSPPVIVDCPCAERVQLAETPTPSRYEDIKLSAADVDTLARLVWLEARGEPFEGQRAVVEVVFNRMLSPSFPDTVEAVVYQAGQFTPAVYIGDTVATDQQYEAVAAALQGNEPITDADVVYFSTSAQNQRVFAIIGNHVFCRE